MATRLIGTDSADPRLPDDVVAATVGTGADDLAAGDTLAQANDYTDTQIAAIEPGGGGSGFIGAFVSDEAPAAATVPAGHYYWDLTRAQPFWSDGAIWRDAGASTSPPPIPAFAVTFTLHEDATVFEPLIYLIPGASGTVQWVNSDDTVIATGVNPSITPPADLEVTMRVVSGEALVMSEVEIINIGFDHTEDTGPETPDAIYDYPPQPVVGISSLSGLTNLKYFMAADTPLTGTVNFTNLTSLIAVECYSSEIEEVIFTGTIINRLCVENCRITNLDLTPIAATVRDLRCATGNGGPVTFHTDEVLEHLWHYCVRDQVVVEHIPQAQMPALIQWWPWNTGLTTMDVPVSPFLNSISAHHNAFTSATVDAWLITLAAGTALGGGFNMLDAEPPTDASAAARATLLARGWTLQLPDPIPGDEGWEYVAPTQVPWVAGALTAIDATPSVASGALSFSDNTWARVIQRPATRPAGDVYFEVVVDRSEVDGTAGTDRWMLIVNSTAAGVGLKALVRWPQMSGADAAGVIIGPSTGWSATSGTAVRINPNPAGWTNAGAHKVGLLLQGNVATIILDGIKVWQAASSAIGTLAASGGYVGVGGDPDGITRTYATWGLTEL